MLSIQNLEIDKNLWTELSQETIQKQTIFLKGSCLACSSTLMMGTIRSSETSVDFYRTTWLYIPEDSKLYDLVFSSRSVGCGSVGANIVSGGSEIY
jgi:hypothetical protein